ncbi:MAG: nickel-dependent hydrogenase large subunit [Deltaproteobacteria bacterium]|jgi:hydrogenase large subunit|nr:nickel-dependent hydrogenase large subunit [Deltaproteobacteria bacterium]MBT4268194.1 nickel-dependent hydrogenase large subunit [Deltaproteobacteria bacterium]MBT4640177.1 nickel-dependent hydrogenase large subunit [Deltaproteobacteria bacterium]MBT6499795.1 nickel-dependent hydrogenase large subunit [Deltaproteobacteria bacterium]MBT6614118.1 nickel-dependent hydrogenase large subunit [Deltaproteobacteria bacterium]
MGKIVTIDPITRIEGHLKIDVEIDNGKITNAWSSGQMFRGIELILQGRDPREAWMFTQRFCGVCTTVHAIASVRAVENALQMEIPLNAQLIRNMIIAAHTMHDHIVHFYHLSALDWVDVTQVLKADPKKASALAQTLSPWKRNTVHEFQAVKDKVKAIVDSGQLGIFSNGYWGHKAMKLPPDVNLIAVTHYLQALEYQRKINDCVGLLGSKTPHIQNLAVGGVANAINLDNETGLNMTRLLKVKNFFDEVRDFVNQVYLIDVAAVGSFYLDWAGYGAGDMNYLAVPEFPTDTKGEKFDMMGGTIFKGNIGGAKAITSFNDPYFRDNVEESIARSWYEGDWQKHPYEETTDVKYTGYDMKGKYSYAKAPRFEGKPMQVGPLAQVLTSFAVGDKRTAKFVNLTVDTIKAVSGKKIPLAALHSTIGRHAARAIRCAVVNEMALEHWGMLVENLGKGNTEYYNKPVFPKGEIQGFGFHEAPRGALSHWVVIENGKIKNYQAVVPSTWNAGPRDAKGQKGPYEASLVGNPIADSKRPLEVLRTIHSFDPCLACAVHAFDPEGNELGVVESKI